MTTQISPMLAVGDGDAAIQFFKSAFGAIVEWPLGGAGHVVAGLFIYGAEVFLANESTQSGTPGPGSLGFTKVKIELFVDDPVEVQKRAVAAGAREKDEVQEHNHPTIGPRPNNRMLQGAVVDPFGHLWLIGKVLD